MLTWLRIENLVLIREAEIDFTSGLTVVTGETGAGKTIFAQALQLLLGQKADSALVGPHGKEAFVQAEFEVPEALWLEPEFLPLAELRPEGEETLRLARRVSREGRSRAYAWSMSIGREQLAAASERLIAVSGQFEQRRLAKPFYQLDLLDAYIGEKQLLLREGAANDWKKLVQVKRQRDEVAKNEEAAKMQIEELNLLVEQTRTFSPGEEQQLKRELDRISRMRELVDAVSGAAALLVPEEDDGAADQTAAAQRLLAPVKELSGELEEVASELAAAETVLREAASTLHLFLSSNDADPRRLEEVENKLSQIHDVKRRFRELDYEQLLVRADKAVEELRLLGDGGDPLAAAEQALAEATESYRKSAAALRKARQEAAPTFAEEATAELRNLAMGSGEMKVEVAEKQSGPSGADEVRLLIRPNAGMPFSPASETASGGELSRVALALRVVAHSKVGEPTVLFDEIDAGIGGVTAHAVADSLRRLAEQAQVIAITHLPQIAAKADGHLQISKSEGEQTLTEISPLDPDERKEELARMLGGSEFLGQLAS